MSWLDRFFSNNYGTIENEGTLVPPENTINFVGMVVTDDPSNSRTTVNVDGVTVGGDIGSLQVHASDGSLDGLVGLAVGDYPYWNGTTWVPSSSIVFDPATLSLTGWWRDYPGTSPWSGTASAGTSTSNSISEATNPPNAGTALNAHATANFDGTNDVLGDSVGSLDTYVNAGDGSGWVLFNADTATSDSGAGTRYNNPQFFIDSNGVMGCGFSTAGVHVFVTDGSNGITEKVIACATGGWHLVSWKYHYASPGLTLSIRLDGGAWQTATSGAGSGLSGTINPDSIHVGPRYTGGTVFFDGRIAEMATSDTFISDANFDNVKSYINNRYSQSF